MSQVPSNLENYRLYLGEENSTNGGGMDQLQPRILKEVDIKKLLLSVVLLFHSVEMISDLKFTDKDLMVMKSNFLSSFSSGP